MQELEILAIPNEPDFFDHVFAPFIVKVAVDASLFVVEMGMNLLVGLDEQVKGGKQLGDARVEGRSF